MLSIITLVITGLVALLLISAVLAPLESLGWWAGWYGDKGALSNADEPQEVDAQPEVDHYIVYLSGIGAITDDSIPEEEIEWLAKFEERLPDTLLITDVFPYSVTNLGLTGQRAFAGLWHKVEQLRLKNPAAISALLVNVRNMLQVAVSADLRYGPIYNLGVAREIIQSLLRHGYQIGSGKPVTMLGWSGGGQISLGTAYFLRGNLKAPIRIISVGGVMADDPGLDQIEHLFHFYGTKDPVQGLGAKLYAGRWPVFAQSRWNRAMRAGKITMTELGPMTHMGTGNYWDWKTDLPDGRSCAQTTLDAVIDVLTSEKLLPPADDAAKPMPI